MFKLYYIMMAVLFASFTLQAEETVEQEIVTSEEPLDNILSLNDDDDEDDDDDEENDEYIDLKRLG